MKLIFTYLFFLYFYTNTLAFTLSTKIINHTNSVNLLVAYEMRMLKHEISNNIVRNNLQKYIKHKHQKAFDEIRDDKVLFSTLSTIHRENSIPELSYLIMNKGNCVSIVPLWNIYFSEVVAVIPPYDALLDACDKYYLPQNIDNEKEIYNIYKFSKIIKCKKSI